ncbi:hypothetical protein [Sphingobacterium griseoflavum]|uniref:Uncharacterized protein n=1 Tax=Sphingobacterium griseoflavum TaxID=1474952 RepID=A0ABQ3HSN2_9SPHI|nr:hypothetical protein [Sphingobacterium griseoflavum]GHE23234.1 hypothetical protein GCM10017764_02020 [Sphingobacterium griseoflavum]
MGKTGLKQYHEEFDALPLEWKISHILSKLRFPFLRHNYLFCYRANQKGRVEVEIEKAVVASGKSYLFVSEKLTAKTLFELLQRNNDKILFLKHPDLWWMAGVADVLCGALNSRPDGKPWEVAYPGEQSFVFNGVLILLSSEQKKVLKNTQRLKYMLRDVSILEL